MDPGLSLVIVLRGTHSARNELRCRQPVKHADPTPRQKIASASRRSGLHEFAPAALAPRIPWTRLHLTVQCVARSRSSDTPFLTHSRQTSTFYFAMKITSTLKARRVACHRPARLVCPLLSVACPFPNYRVFKFLAPLAPPRTSCPFSRTSNES